MDQLPDAKEVLKELFENSRPLKEIKKFSDSPGIYGVFFYGNDFPLKDIKDDNKNGILIYIGKTESSQLKRDVKQHFTDGRTGSSTLRRSLGALLRSQLKLNPIPRSTKERSDNKYLMYKFDEKSEKDLTLWMKENLGLAFFDFDKTSKEIGQLEENLIHLAVLPSTYKITLEILTVQ